MKRFFALTIMGLLSLVSHLFTQQKEPATVHSSRSLYDFTMRTIEGKEKALSEYKGKVLLIVNVASYCGYTPQYTDLEATYKKYKEKGFSILAFPANNFGHQEPGTDEEIKEFCQIKYDVTFDLFSKISVKGNDQHPLYQYITKESPLAGEVKWNFQKYLIDKKGNIVAMFPSRMKPTDKVVEQRIEGLLNERL